MSIVTPLSHTLRRVSSGKRGSILKTWLGIGMLAVGLGNAMPALAGVLPTSMNFKASIGLGEETAVTIAWTRDPGASDHILVTIPPELALDVPSLPAYCSYAAPVLDCNVPTSDETGVTSFNVTGAQTGGFNLSTTGTPVGNSGTVYAGGEVSIGKVKTSPTGNPIIANNNTVFTLTPNLAAGSSNVPAGSRIIVRDTLPGGTETFELTNVSFTGRTPTCNAISAANASRVLECYYEGPLTPAELNASTITVTGKQITNGTNFTNTASISSHPLDQYYTIEQSNAVSYDVTPGTDIVATASLPNGNPTATGSSRTFTFGYRNDGPQMNSAGGLLETVIPPNITPDTSGLPAACTVTPNGSRVVGGTTYTGTVISCPAPSLNVGQTYSLSVPVVMPGVEETGVIPVLVTPPSGQGDANLNNNGTTAPYRTTPPSADLTVSAKSKSPSSGAVRAGDTISTTLTVQNLAGSTASATYSAANPLRVVDYVRPEEIAGTTVTVTNSTPAAAAWQCDVQHGASGAPDADRTTRVSCYTTNATPLTLNAGSTASVTFSSTIAALPAGTQSLHLTDRACTGGTALTQSGAATTHTPADTNAGNDCREFTGQLHATEVTTGKAEVSITKQSAVDVSGATTTYQDATIAPANGDNTSTLYWRMVITRPTVGQENIPRLTLTDVIPGIIHLTAPAGMTNHRTGITVTATESVAGDRSAECSVSGTTTRTLTCNLDDVAPGATITVDVAVARPFAAGLHTNTATLTSNQAQLTPSTGGQLSDTATIDAGRLRSDVALSEKTFTPDPVLIGEYVTYTLTSQNRGPSAIAAGEFVVEDQLNVGTWAANNPSYEDITAPNTSNMACTVTAGLVRCVNTAPIAPYSEAVINIKARIVKPDGPAYAGQTFSAQNTATVTLGASYCEFRTEAPVSAACGDANAQSNNAVTKDVPMSAPLIDLVQRKDPVYPRPGDNTFRAGDQLRYRFSIGNYGPSRAENWQMKDVLSFPTGVNVVYDHVENVGAGAKQFGAAFTLLTSADVGVQCSIDNSLSGVNQIVCNPTATRPYLNANEELNFEVVFNVVFSDPAASARPFRFQNQAYVCADETRSKHERLGWECTVNPATGLPTGDVGNNVGSAASVIFPVADLTVSKQTLLDPALNLPAGTPASPVDIGQSVLYKLVLRNLGDSATTKMRFVDLLPAGFEWIQGPLPVTAEAGAPTIGAATLPVLGSVPADGENDNGCFISNGVTNVGPADRQQITCDVSGIFGKDQAVAVMLRARVKPGYTGPYAASIDNDVEIMPGRIKTNRDGVDVVEQASVDNNPGNNSATSPVEVRNTRIAGRVFVDLNNNGDQDSEIASGDQGIGNVTLTLTGTDKFGNPVSRTVTTSDVPAGPGSLRGDYLFDNLPPSDANGYTITQTQPTGFGNGTPQPNTIRTVRNVDSTGVTSKGTANNPDADSSVISGIVVEGGANGVQFDFPETTTASSTNLKISGHVYVDADNDGNFDAGERVLPNVTVTLIGCSAGDDNVVNTASVGTSQPAVCHPDDVPVTFTTTTDANGFYNFPLEKPGRYTVIQQTAQPVVDGVETLRGKTTAGSVDKTGSAAGANDGGTPGTATTVPNEISGSAPSSISNILISDSTAQSVNNNFGEVLPGSISGFVYTEKGTPNSNYDPAVDWPFAGVTVTLTGNDDLGNPVNVTVTTQADGSYRFDNLRPSGAGGYTVTKTNPSRPGDPVINEPNGAYPGTDENSTTRGTRSGDEVVNTIVLTSGRQVTQTNFAVTNGTRVELALAKRHVGDVIVGQQATYELTVTNKGDSPTFGTLQLADTLPPGMSLIATDPITSAMGTISNMVVSGQTVRFDFLPTNPIPITNGTAVLQVHVDVAALAQGDAVINYATVTGGGDPYVPPGTPGPGCTDQHCAQDEVKVFGPPVLALAKTGPATLFLGGTDEYTLTITNSGEAATIGTLSLIEHLPPGLDLDPANPLASSDGVISNVVRTGDIANGVIVTFDFAPTTPLAPANGTADIRVPVTIDVTTPIGVSTNYASVGGGGDTRGNPPTPGSNCSDTRCANVPANVEGAGLLSIVKTANKREAELGDMVSYTLEISNISQAMVVRPNIVDRLPQGFRLIDDTSRVRGATLLEMKGAPGPVITYSLDQIAPGAKVTITYRVRLGVGGMQGDGVNRASAECPLNPNTKCSNEARWRVKVSGGVFTDDACIVGMVYVDCNGNQIKDHEELGVPGVRLYAENGLFLISDSEGKYSYCGFSPKTHVLKVDSTTLPRGSRLVVSSNRNVGDANSLFLDLKKGELQRADFIEGSCSNTVLEQVKARRTQGEISAPHVEKKGGVGFTFEGKAPNYPQQGTDSANQVIVKPRMDSREAIEKAVPAETVSERDTPVRQLEINQGGRDAR